MVFKSGLEAFTFRFLEAIPFIEKKKEEKKKRGNKSMVEYDAMVIVIQHKSAGRWLYAPVLDDSDN